MPATVNVNLRTVVHGQSSGIASAFPDPCKTPTPGGPVPIPYPNVSQSTDTSQGSASVKCDGQPIMLKGSKFAVSTGDDAGSAGGNVVTNQLKGASTFAMYSFDVKVEGKAVPRQLDLMICNINGQVSGTPPVPCVQPGGAAPAALAGDGGDEERGPVEIAWDGE